MQFEQTSKIHYKLFLGVIIYTLAKADGTLPRGTHPKGHKPNSLVRERASRKLGQRKHTFSLEACSLVIGIGLKVS